MKMIKIINCSFQIILAILLTGALSSSQSEEKEAGSTPQSKVITKQKTIPATNVASPDSAVQKVAAKQEQRKLVVYYLHGTFRCPSCNKIENLTKAAVEQGFADQIKKGRVEMKVLNVEESGNEHFVEDYKLYTKSVILSDLRDGKEAKWKNLDQIWTLLGSDEKFIEYIQKEVKTYLEG